MFQVLTVPDNAWDLPEQLGTKPKFWFRNDQSMRCLFKEVQPGRGEDWSEKAASELCELVGLPHAHYDLAIWRGRNGVVTPTFVPDGGRLVHGNELLAKVVPGYPEREFYGVKQHTLRIALQLLRNPRFLSPIGWSAFPGASTPLDVFVGYVMLDAWIANQDRHHENWSLVVSPVPSIHLAPSYDHASSLGRNETDENRRERLTTRNSGRSMEHYVERARSAFYASPSSTKPMTTLAAFAEAAKARPPAARAWLDRLAAVSSDQIRGLFDQIPPDRITRGAVEFAQRILELNQQRLLNLRGQLP